MSKQEGAAIIERMIEATGCETQAALARKLGVGRDALSHYKKKDGVPSDWLLSLAQDGLNPAYLLTGEGPKSLLPGEEKAMAAELPGTIPAQIPLVAGQLNKKGAFKPLPTSMNPYWFSVDHLRELSTGDPSRLIMMEFRGEHMAPEIMDGDVVIVDQSDTFPAPYALMAATIEGCLGVYRVTVTPGEVSFHGTDRRFPVMKVRRDLLGSPAASIEGMVVGVIRTYRRG